MTENTDRMPQEPENTEYEAENMSGEAVLLDETSAARGMKKQYDRIGWALVTVVLVWQVLMLLVGIVMSVIELTTGFAMVDAYYRYLLLINEAALAVGILAGARFCAVFLVMHRRNARFLWDNLSFFCVFATLPRSRGIWSAIWFSVFGTRSPADRSVPRSRRY